VRLGLICVNPGRAAFDSMARLSFPLSARGKAMHIVIWNYKVMEGKSRQDLQEAIQADAPQYQGVPGLIRMDYGFAVDLKSVVQVYLWRSREEADRFFNPEWDGATSRRWESAGMTRSDYEAPVLIEGGKAG
jgi:hypothetical protein